MKKLILIIFCMILLVGTVSAAWEFDNVKDYDKKTKTIKVKNAFGLGKNIANIILDTPLIVYVIRGEDRKVAEFTINNLKDYDKAFNKMKFFNIKKNMKSFERDFDYKYKKSLGLFDVNDYESVCIEKEAENKSKYNDCHSEIIGTHKEERFEWVKLDTLKKLPKGEITIGVFTDVYAGDNVEWIPTLFGVEIGEWAVWTESLNVNLIGYWALNSSAGTTAVDSVGDHDGLLIGHDIPADWVSGHLGNALNFDGGADFVNITASGELADNNFGNDSFSFCLWANTSVQSNSNIVLSKRTSGAAAYPLEVRFGKATSGVVQLNTQSSEVIGTTDVANGTYHFLCGVRDTALDKSILYIDGSHEKNETDTGDLSNYANVTIGKKSNGGDDFTGEIDEVAIWSRALSVTEITQLYNIGIGITYISFIVPPTVTLNSPIEAFNTTNPTIDFRGIASADFNLTNLSFILDDVVNKTIVDLGNTSSFNEDCKSVTYGYLTNCDDEMFDGNFSSYGFYNYTGSTPRTELFLEENFGSTQSAGQVNLTVKWGITTCGAGGCQAGYGLTCLNHSSGSYITQFSTNVASSNQDMNTTSTITIDNSCIARNITIRHTALNVRGMSGGFSDVRLFDVNVSNQYNFTRTLSDGTHNWTFEACDIVSCVNATTRNLTIDSTIPTINITYPLNATYITNQTTADNVTIRLNWTTTDTHLDKCWYYNTTDNVTVTCDDNATVYLPFDSYTFIMYANDTLGNENSTNVTATWKYKIYQTAENYSTPITVGDTDDFQLNITLGTSYNLSSAQLFYDDVFYSTSITSTAQNYTIEKTLDILYTSSTENRTFFWQIDLDDSTQYNTTAHNQTINPLEIDNCSVNTIMLYNFTIVDEITQAEINESHYNLTTELNLQIYTSDGDTEIQNFTTSWSEVNPFTICLNNSLSGGETYNINLELQFDGDDYSSEFYYIQQATIDNSSFGSNITLYDLDDDNTQEFKLTYKDENLIAVIDALIQIQRKYVSEGVFKTVEILKTDFNGETIGHLQLSDVVYTFIVTKNGVTLSTFNNVIAYCDNVATGDCEINLDAFSSHIQTEDFETSDDFSYTFTWNDTSREVTTIFSIPSGASDTILMNVTLYDQLGNQEICYDSLTSTSGTLTCTIPTTFGNATAYVDLSKGGTQVGQAFVRINQEPSDIYGSSIVFLGILLTLTILGIGISDNPMVTGFFLLLGAILNIAFNIIDTTGYIGAGATILWLFIAIILILIKGGNRQ